MTDLLKQARHWRDAASKPTREINGFDWINLKAFLTDLIEHLEEAGTKCEAPIGIDERQFCRLNAGHDGPCAFTVSHGDQRTHTLAIMAASLCATSKIGDWESRKSTAVEAATQLLAEVEKRK